MPYRKVSSYGNVLGQFPSVKLNRMVGFESLIERDFLYLLDHDPAVTWFREQPFTITYFVDGRKFRYTPDFHVIRLERDIVYECKQLAEVNKPANLRKFGGARPWCAERDWTFQVVTDAELRTGFKLNNVKLLTQFARYSVTQRFKVSVQASLRQGQLPLGSLVQALSDDSPSLVLPYLYCMAFHHEISIELAASPICERSMVSLEEME